ncbi:MAG: class I SAM-dependent methyltransferase [Rhizobiaceae bacterium]|nr:class I SAM-dependent methyltransferase [Rhizobiaceae bacterium]
MTKPTREQIDAEFAARRAKAREEVNKLDRNTIHSEPERGAFFNTVYDRANDDAAQIPWADLAPKPQLAAWLKANPGNGQTALDIACGLGDNAEEIAAARYDTTAFDLSQTAIDWAKQRFPSSKVKYLAASLFEPPMEWRGGFELVNECYTLQALPPQMLDKSTRAIANLVKPGGTLLVYSRMRHNIETPDGPPWPLHENDLMKFADLGFSLVADERFEVVRGERKVHHQFAHWHKSP